MSKAIIIGSVLLLLGACNGLKRSCPCSHPDATGKDEALKANPVRENSPNSIGKNF